MAPKKGGKRPSFDGATVLAELWGPHVAEADSVAYATKLDAPLDAKQLVKHTALLQATRAVATSVTPRAAKDVLANGSGKIGSKSADTIEGLATWLTGGECDGILRRSLEEGQACAGEKDGLAACRRCAERGMKGGRLLRLVRENAAGIGDFVGRGCRER
ncbi:unnamed protein product [Prorocentrum cordatum]|uniref:Uncharacterized protein n=1 Tax=Prorocentrum cordatum TaxID=2364126 RepID=A0ABN9S9S7_9DINO|nr:unnamed protein product [Polarella glacialis]